MINFFNKKFVRFSTHMIISFLLCYYFIAYAALVPETAIGAFLTFVAAATVVWLLSYLVSKNYFQWVIHLIRLSIYFIKEFLRSNYTLTKEIVTPGLDLSPAVAKVPLDIKSNGGIMALASITNLTPGTLILGVSEDKKYLFIHTLYLDQGTVEQFKQEFKSGFEKRLIKLQ